MNSFLSSARFSLAIALLIVGNIATLAQQQKFALVIGVKSYTYVTPLQNSLNDARDMSATLKKKGFTVVEVFEPATKRIMQDGIIRYFKLLQGNPNAAGLVFYSGHGMQVKGVNYLIPAQANPQIEADLDDQCVNMDYVMRAIQEAGNGLNIFVLDACRNNPFRSFSRSGEKGLTMVDAPQGSYIVYATKPGSVASDGTGRNGLFTSKLLQYINTEGLNIEQVFKQVARDVATDSGNEQRPWIASDYTGDFYFTPGLGATTTTTQPITQPIVKSENTSVPVSSPPSGAGGLDYGYGTAGARTVNVGTQEWLGKNLNVDRFANGDPILEAKTEGEWARAGENKQPAWCYYNNDPALGRTYGKLYNWYAVNDPRGLAPSGWHVPSDDEWTALTNYLGGEAAAGLPMKSTSGWLENGNGNNSSGIAGLPGGLRSPNGSFNYLGKLGYWWSASESASDKAWYRVLYYNFGGVFRYGGSKSCGFSVRCLRD
jgi:uncharacterized protein (TIGR02145 family)